MNFNIFPLGLVTLYGVGGLFLAKSIRVSKQIKGKGVPCKVEVDLFHFRPV